MISRSVDTYSGVGSSCDDTGWQNSVPGRRGSQPKTSCAVDDLVSVRGVLRSANRTSGRASTQSLPTLMSEAFNVRCHRSSTPFA